MVSIILSSEQVRAAPPEVRRWIENVVRRELTLEQHNPLQRNGFRYDDGNLAICGLPEVSQIFTLLRQETVACRLFLALGCDNYDRATGLHVPRKISIAALQQHFGVSDFGALVPALELINNAVRQVRRDDLATLFLLEGEEALIVHEETQWHIHQLLQLLTRAEQRQGNGAGKTPTSVSVAPPYHAPLQAPPAPATVPDLVPLSPSGLGG